MARDDGRAPLRRPLLDGLDDYHVDQLRIVAHDDLEDAHVRLVAAESLPA